MEVKVYNSFNAIPDDVAHQWSYPQQPNFFLSLDWYVCLYETALNTTADPKIYCLLNDDSEPLGLLCCARPHGKNELLGMTNFYTMEYAPIVFSKDTSIATVSEKIFQYIRSETPKTHLIDFRLVEKSSLDDAKLEMSLQKNGFSVDSFFMYDNWFLEPCGRDFDSYYESRSSRLRNTIKRKEKKLAKSHEYTIALHTDLGPALNKAITDYVGIYNKSWKNPEPFPEFIPRLVKTAAKLGILRLGVLYIGDEAAAAQLWITTPEKALIYKLAYDEKYSNFSAGSILSREMFRQAIDDDQVKEIDYGVGSENYKKEWMESVRRLNGLRALNMHTLKGFSLFSLEKTLKQSKKLAKSISSRSIRSLT